MDSEKISWEVIDALFTNSGATDCPNYLVRHQVESYNEFLDKKLSQIIQGFNPIQVCHNFSQELGEFKFKINLNVLNPNITKPIFQSYDGSQTPMTPYIARMNQLTYSANLYVDVHAITETINEDGVIERKETNITGVSLGKIPIMVRSKACILNQLPGIETQNKNSESRYDYGGYFIVGGNEKVVIAQDRISENETLVFAPNGSADGLYAEIRSMPDGIFLPPKTTSLHLAGKANHIGHLIKLNASFLRSEIPLFVMFRALGIESDKDIIAHIVLNTKDPKNKRIMNELLACAEDASNVHTQEDAFVYILKILGTTGTPREYMEQQHRAFSVVRAVITQDFLSHVGPSFNRKALYLGYMVRKLLSIFLGYQNCDNRDSYLHKRIDTTGVLFSNLFRQCYGKMIKETRNLIVRELNLWRANDSPPIHLIKQENIHRFFKQTLIETGLRYALSTGNWGIKSIGSFQNIRQGVAQVLNRMSHLSTLSHLRRVNTPMEKNGMLVQPRKLENTQFGMICPAETPEGASVGLVKNMALSTHITVNISSSYVRELIKDLGTNIYDDTIEDCYSYLEQMGTDGKVSIMINGDIIGYHDEADKLYQNLIEKKRNGSLPPVISIIWNVRHNIIKISTEAGRMCRPMFVVNNKSKNLEIIDYLQKNKITWDEYKKGKGLCEYLIGVNNDHGFIEFMDVEELDKAMVAMFPHDLKRSIKGTTLPPEFTHCEINPSLMSGVLATNIPFMNHNQSPRNCYQCLWIEEPVLNIDGSVTKIKDMVPVKEDTTTNIQIENKPHSTVVSFYTPNPEKPTEPADSKKNMEQYNSTICFQQISVPTNQLYKVKTISGRGIITTSDHKYRVHNINTGELEWQIPLNMNNNTLLGIHHYPKALDRMSDNYLSTINTIDDYIIDNQKNLQLFPVFARIAGYINKTNNPTFIPSDPTNSSINSTLFKQDYQLFSTMNFANYITFPDWITNISEITTDNALYVREYISGYMSAYIENLVNQNFNSWDIIINVMNNINNPSIVSDTSNTLTPSITNLPDPLILNLMSQLITYIYNKYPELYDINTNNSNTINPNSVKTNIAMGGTGYNTTDASFTIGGPGQIYDATINNILFSKNYNKCMLIKTFNDMFSIPYNSQSFIQITKISEYMRYFILNCNQNISSMSLSEWYNSIISNDNNIFVPFLDKTLSSVKLVADITVNDGFNGSTSVSHTCHSFIGGDGFTVSNSAMGKQAVGIYLNNFNQRIDTMAHILHYPQKPLAQTKLSKYTFNDYLPSGINGIVAVMCHTGFNQEDSVMVNKASLDRGLFGTTYFKSYRDKCNKNHSTGEEEIFTKPVVEEFGKVKPFNYDKLDEDGFIPKNTYVNSNDILVGKVMPYKVQGVMHTRDSSLQIKGNDEGYIDMNYSGMDGEGYKFCKVRLRKMRKPVIGDKLSSRHAQKGTIGMIYPEQDMPFTKDGIRPDIIMNPHAIPSRMTIAQLMECIMGKAACHIGALGDATPFTGCSVESIADILETSGYERYGNEILYNGRTGEQMKVEIFMGPVYYQRLKHMVADKQHCLTAEHTVMCEDGWKPIDTVKLTDKVAILKDNKLLYENPLEIYDYPDFEGDMYHISNQAVDLDVTMNHRMYVSKPNTREKIWSDYTLDEAKDIMGKYVKYKKACDRDVEDYQFSLPALSSEKENCEDKKLHMDSWLTFFGIWMTKGCAYINKDNQNIIEITLNKQYVIDLLNNAITKLGYEYQINSEKITINDKQLYTYIVHLCVDIQQKRLPKWCFNLSKIQSQKLVHSMQLGDGSINQFSNDSIYCTSSIGLADDLQRLCIHAGWSGNITKWIETDSKKIFKCKEATNYTIWKISIIKNRNNPSVNGPNKSYNNQTEYTYHYKGPVYCMRVSSEVFMIRKNGKAVWTGNSRGNNGPVVALTRQPAEGRARNGGLRFGEMERDATVAHGAGTFLKERMLDVSDNFRVFICRKCGMMCTANPDKNIFKCNNCGNNADITQVRIPYSMKLLMQELMTLQVGIRLVV